MRIGSFIDRSARSFRGNLRIIGLPAFAAEFLAFTWPDLTRGTLTFGRVLHVAIVCAIGAILGTLFVWYVLLRPYMRSRGIPEWSDRESND